VELRLHAFSTLAYLSLGKKPSRIHWIDDYVIPRAGLDAVKAVIIMTQISNHSEHIKAVVGKMKLSSGNGCVRKQTIGIPNVLFRKLFSKLDLQG
jgi:hypothetical protein